MNKNPSTDINQETDYSDGKASARLINDWVEKITQSKIKDLIKPDMLNSLTRLVLVNAIYFKGDWASKFDVKNTADQVGPHSTFITLNWINIVCRTSILTMAPPRRCQ